MFILFFIYLLGAMVNISFQGKFLCFFLEVFYLVAHQWTVKRHLDKEPMAEPQCIGSVFRRWKAEQATKEFRNHIHE